MKKLSIVILVIGIGLLCYSFTLKPFTNAAEYDAKYLSINWQLIGSDQAAQQFYSLREEYLTNKYRLEDYGFTFILTGLFCMIFLGSGWASLYAPNSKWKIIAVGMFAALTTVIADVGDLLLEMHRGSYPHWADSLGIPLMEVPFIALILFFWAIINLLGIRNKFVPGATISQMGVKNLNIWFLFLSLSMITMTGVCIINGCFWLIVPGLSWLYFYLSILAGRKAANVPIQIAQVKSSPD